jgi:flagellar motor switch protein FliN/FliY
MSVSAIRPTEVPPAEEGEEKTAPPAPSALHGEILRGVRVSLEVRLGEAKMTVDEMMALKQGAVVTLDAGLSDYVELFLNGTLVARGEIVAVGDKFAVKIAELAAAP